MYVGLASMDTWTSETVKIVLFELSLPTIMCAKLFLICRGQCPSSFNFRTLTIAWVD